MELLTDLPPEPPETSNLIHKHRLLNKKFSAI